MGPSLNQTVKQELNLVCLNENYKRKFINLSYEAKLDLLFLFVKVERIHFIILHFKNHKIFNLRLSQLKTKLSDSIYFINTDDPIR